MKHDKVNANLQGAYPAYAMHYLAHIIKSRSYMKWRDSTPILVEKSSRIPNTVQLTSWEMHKRLIHGNKRRLFTTKWIIRADVFMQGPIQVSLYTMMTICTCVDQQSSFILVCMIITCHLYCFVFVIHARLLTTLFVICHHCPLIRRHYC